MTCSAMPKGVLVLAILFVLPGASAPIEMLVDLAANHININVGELLLPTGTGLLR